MSRRRSRSTCRRTSSTRARAMAIEKWRPILLAVLAVVLAVVVYIEWPQTRNAARTTTAPSKAAGRTPSASNTATTPDVHLKSLDEGHTQPGEAERDLFRFKTKPAPPPPPRPAATAPPVVPSGPPPPPPLPPIALKFI